MGEDDAIVVLVTGTPVPTIEASRGGFDNMFSRAIGDGWRGAYHVLDARECPALSGLKPAGVIITGSSANVYDREPWMDHADDWLRELVPAGVPTLGVCFGHQMLAHALGGEVVLNPRGREISTVEVEWRGDDDTLLHGLPARFAVNACHTDTVRRLPDGAQSLARSEQDHHQVIRFAERCYGVQFHPEFDRWVMRGYVAARGDEIAAEGGNPVALTQQAIETPAGPQLLQHFVERLIGAA
jgi:GMP synthase (glutamine-hydrolysing)